MPNPQPILDFWFQPSHQKLWFQSTPEFDAEIRAKFLPLYEQAREGTLNEWAEASPEAALALVILLDQFPRNLFRGKAEAFATDAQALDASRRAMTRGFDERLEPQQRRFLYMPYMHSESLPDQEEGVALFEELGNPQALDYARQHRDVIRSLGRFPFRNAALGRASTPQEIEFMATHNPF